MPEDRLNETQFQPTYSLEAADIDRRRAWLSLRKLLVLLVLMAAVPLMVVELISNERDQEGQIERARDSMDALAEVIAGSNARTVEGVGQFLIAVAAAPVVAGEDREGCARYLRRLLSLEPSYLNIGLIGLDGRLGCEATGKGHNVDLGDRDFFTRALSSGQLTVSAFQVGRVTGRHSIVFARPVEAETGRIKGVLHVALDLGALGGSVRGGNAVPGACVQLVDTAGAVLASGDGDASFVGAPLTDPVLRQAVGARRTGRLIGPQGEEPALLRTLHPVKVRGEPVMYVAVAVPTQQITAPLQSNLRGRLAGILAIALAVAAAVWGVGHRLIVRPVERLIAGLRHVETGDYARALHQPGTPLRELGELQRSLASLVMTLEAQRFERDQALGALSDRETRYRELFKANPQVMYVYEVESLRFLAVNEAATAYYGYTHDDMLKLALPDIWPGQAQASALDPVPGNGPAPAVVHRKKSGETRLVEVIVSPMVFEGYPAELVMVTDVTERLATQARVREGAERLEQRVAERTRELELSIRELEAFSYSVSHDLRNPLGAVGMFGQMLAAHLGDGADEQSQLYLARIEQGVRGMEALIDDLLTLAQVARAQLVMAPVDLTALCREVIDGLRLTEPQRVVEVSLEEGLQCTGDAGLLRQLLVNLLGNAWKFTARTPQPRIRVGREPGAAGAAAAFFVQDNGAGFDMKFAGRLFLPFERLHGDHDFPGTGIGLATVQRIVARHGGRIWAEAAPEQGATFHVELGARVPD